MKIALCMSGHMRSFARTYPNLLDNLIQPNDCDVFVYTSDINSYKIQRSEGQQPPLAGKIYNNSQWSLRRGGGFYKVNKSELEEKIINLYGSRLKKLIVEEETIAENQLDQHSWEWRRKLFEKTYKCNKMFQEYCQENNVKYDAVIRTRADLAFRKVIDVKRTLGKNDKDIHVFGGWNPRGRLEELGFKEYLFDGFAYATPENIDSYCNLYLREKPYENKATNLEIQLSEYLIENNFCVNYIGESQNKDLREYSIVR